MKTLKIPNSYRHYRVEPLRFWDVAQLARLEQTVFPEPMTPGQIRRKGFWPGTRARYLVVKDGSRVVAYFGFEVFGRYAHVLANVTHPDYRRRGLAVFVLTAAEPWAASFGARAFLGEVRRSNEPQLEVLKTIGWGRLTLIPGFFGNGEDAYIVMKVFD